MEKNNPCHSEKVQPFVREPQCCGRAVTWIGHVRTQGFMTCKVTFEAQGSPIDFSKSSMRAPMSSMRLMMES
eukprot:3141937-Amphidinium_carterae.1